MPYTNAQYRLFAAAAHNKDIAKKTGIKPADAKRMAAEVPKQQRSAAMRAPKTVFTKGK